ncbi:MAG: hypothetical protein IJV76_07315, partial [Clostridia bacterium]|nr:hypothetical protein [Clostridia bacterium]
MKLSRYFSRPGAVKHTVQKALGAIALLIFMLIMSAENPPHPGLTGSIILVLYLMSLWAVGFLFRVFGMRITSVTDEAEATMLHSITLDLISRLYMPVLICDEDGRIIWYNKALSQIFHAGEVLYGRYLDQYCPATVREIRSSDAPDGFPVAVLPTVHAHFHNNTVFDEERQTLRRDFRVKNYDFTSEGKNYTLLFWNDKRDLVTLEQKMENAESVVGYILIDNLDEVLQYVGEQYRLAAAQVESILNRWIADRDGLIREYERNKYLIVFEARHLEALRESRFSVMDEIQTVRVCESNMHVTISMGLAHVGGTLTEKEAAARAALDLALQRGGDQVVYKTEAGVEFYGGRTKSVQKRTKVKSRVFAGELAALIADASNVLIMGHRFSDHDSIGSCIGIARLCMFCGVSAKVIINRDCDVFRILASRLTRYEEYADMFIDANTGLDLIGSTTLLIVVDTNNFVISEAPEVADNVPKIAII